MNPTLSPESADRVGHSLAFLYCKEERDAWRAPLFVGQSNLSLFFFQFRDYGEVFQRGHVTFDIAA